ncbi:hypothetical protein DOTSEDRAFT_75259 [Dothistroma septosporum NZE10]|uniref:Uncharacterized protein n=1 Tax=Dothistroma septosporum (strain NZE10 / CBS 128990) TaxID=675120 RepID=M2XJ95_DOTSN|nr:hypothetical protein DOTSEDRAFT_75259 [Dothistroma septosporum NZE10]
MWSQKEPSTSWVAAHALPSPSSPADLPPDLLLPPRKTLFQDRLWRGPSVISHAPAIVLLCLQAATSERTQLSAMSRFFAIAELAAVVLLELTPQEILLDQRVCKDRQQSMLGPRAPSQVLGLEPVGGKTHMLPSITSRTAVRLGSTRLSL